MCSVVAAAAQSGAVSQALFCQHQESHSEHQKCPGRRQWAPCPVWCPAGLSCSQGAPRMWQEQEERGAQQDQKVLLQIGCAGPRGGCLPQHHGTALPWTALADPWVRHTQHQQAHLSALELEVWLLHLDFIALLSPPEQEWKDSGQMYTGVLLPRQVFFGVSS